MFTIRVLEAQVKRLSMSTGLRASELASLTKESLSLDTNPPTVKVKAGYSKRRRLDILPLPEDILDAAREWLAGKTGLLWPGKWAKNRVAGKMLQVDLKAVGIPYQDAEGLFADFHALRHTFITNLGLNGVPLVTTQKRARHSTPVLTVKYTHIGMADQHKEVQQLPLSTWGAIWDKQVTSHVPKWQQMARWGMWARRRKAA